MSLTFGLDFDNTYTADPILWRMFFLWAKQRGHKVYIVTLRSKNSNPLLFGVDPKWEDEFDYLYKEYGIDTVFCASRAKKGVCEQKDIKIDIWIDDHPEFINYQSPYELGVAQLGSAPDLESGGR